MKSSSYWIETVFRPEILFLLGTLQAVLPYLSWIEYGANVNYTYNVSYIPLAIYSAGYLAFLAGASLVRRPTGKKQTAPVILSLSNLKMVVGILFVACALQAILVMRVYGGIPLLGYLQGSTDVWSVNDVQADAAFGQLGILTLSTFIFTGFLLLVLVQEVRVKPGTKVLFLASMLLIAIIGSMAGKRQGLLMCLLFLLSGIAVSGYAPVGRFLLLGGLPGRLAYSPIVRIAAVSVGALLIVSYITVLEALRSGRSGTSLMSLEGIVNYLEIPLINFEYQCQLAGYGPYQASLRGLLIGLLPYRWGGSVLDAIQADFKYPEPTAMAGLYGPLHLYVGFWGCIGFTFALGAFCKFVYVRARTQPLMLLLYAQCAWPLFISHSFNLFVILLYVPAPALCFAIIYGGLRMLESKGIGRENRGVAQVAQSERPRLGVPLKTRNRRNPAPYPRSV